MSDQISIDSVIKELDRRADLMYHKARATKKADKIGYEAACTTLVMFKLWITKQKIENTPTP